MDGGVAMSSLNSLVEVKKVDAGAYIVKTNSISNLLSSGTRCVIEAILSHNSKQPYELNKKELVDVHCHLEKAIEDLSSYNKHILKLIEK